VHNLVYTDTILLLTQLARVLLLHATHTTYHQVAAWVRDELRLPSIAEVFVRHYVDGSALLKQRDLVRPVEGLGIADAGEREQIMACIRSLHDGEHSLDGGDHSSSSSSSEYLSETDD
jgi:SAM domain (Sterile alpha motif)